MPVAPVSGGAPMHWTPPLPRKYEKIEKLFKEYGWSEKGLLDPQLLQKDGYSDFLEFLYSSKLIYSIRGYEVSSNEGLLTEGIRLEEGEPFLLKEGTWAHWTDVMSELHFDSARREIVDAEEQDWSYVYPHGLIPQSRYNWVEPIHQLSQQQIDTLYTHAKKFLNQDEESPSKENCNYIQVFTGGKNRLDQIGHVGFRMIDKEGRVYSLGFETPGNEAKISIKKMFSVLATYNVTVASLDFKEFSKFESRRTTTIPISEEKFHRALEKVREYARTPLRFNMLHQNCATFAKDILHEVGVEVDSASPSFLEGLYHLLPPAETIPVIGSLLRRIIDMVKAIFGMIFKYTPAPIKFVVIWITEIALYPFVLVKNTAYLIFGAAKIGTPPRSDEHSTDNSQRLTSFKRVFNHWTDFFKHDALNIHLPLRFTDWQMKQGSTATYTFDGPKFYIVPEEN